LSGAASPGRKTEYPVRTIVLGIDVGRVAVDEILPLLIGGVLPDERHDIAFFVVDVVVGVGRQLLDGSAGVLSQVWLSTAGPSGLTD
jgi:hypothetical protein